VSLAPLLNCMVACCRMMGYCLALRTGCIDSQALTVGYLKA
jgi:hypothetical protein